MRSEENRLALAKELNPSTVPEDGLTIQGFVIKAGKSHGVELVTIKDPTHRPVPAWGIKAELFGTDRSLDAIYRWLLELDRADEAKAAAEEQS